VPLSKSEMSIKIVKNIACEYTSHNPGVPGRKKMHECNYSPVIALTELYKSQMEVLRESFEIYQSMPDNAATKFKNQLIGSLSIYAQ